MTHNGEFCQKSGLDWLKMAKFTQFTTFPIFCHQSISFLEKFLFWGRGYISKFCEFFKSFHTKPAQNDPQWPIWPPKWLRLAWNGQFWLNFNKNLNISVESWPICTEPSEQDLFFWAGWNEFTECYAMIKTDENLNISAESWPICTEPSEQDLFFWAGWNEFTECYAMIKTDKNSNISVEFWPICTKPSEQGSFLELVEMSPRSAMLQSKLMKT